MACVPESNGRAPVTERTNKEWVAALRGAEREEALSELRVVLVRGLRAALGSRRGGVPDAAIEDFAQEGLIKILHNLDTFRGESRFTTWAQIIAVRVAYAELRRKRWQDISLQEVVGRHEAAGRREERLADPHSDPERSTTRRIMLETVEHFVEEELTERQRKAMIAVMFEGMPLEAVARRLGTNRNALYKLLHDARKKLKRRMEDEGFSSRDVVAVFDER